MYDVIIIGAGPAGISASLYAKRANLNVLVLYYGESNLEKAIKIDNYYGFKDGISGEELYEDGIKQAESLGVDVKKLEVVGIENLGEQFKVKTEGENFESKALIIATGNRKVKPNIKGIEEFDGRGISNEATELAHVANKVTILTNGLEKPECDFEINTNKIKEIKGEEKVSEIEFENGSNLYVDGVFVALGEAGAGDFAKTLGIIQNGDNIDVNEKMETNVEGIYACGNITGGLLQVCKAVYEGAEAGLSAVNYIRNK
jgi:thioredoxin reductase (NADPH)